MTNIINEEEIMQQKSVFVKLDPEFYNENFIKKYGSIIECKILNMNGYYTGCSQGEIFYWMLTIPKKQELYVPSRLLIQQNIIYENKKNMRPIKFNYNGRKYNGNLDHKEKELNFIIGQDNLLYIIKQNNIF